MILRGQATASSRAAAISHGSPLGAGLGKLEIGLDILFLQPQERRGHQAHPRQEIAPGKSGVVLRPLAPVLQLDHFRQQGQAQGGAVGRGGAAAGIRPGLGQGFQERRIHVPPLGKVGARFAVTGDWPNFYLIVGLSRDEVNLS